jgi:PPOX class probable FMN-dependent enzyme
MYEPKEIVSTEAEVREILGEVLYSQDTKVIDHIDEHCRTWIERSTFVVVSTVDQAGRVDVAPKGDPAGSWKILDPHTIAIPDRLGNNRADTLANIIDNPRIGLMFVVAPRKEVVRVSGTAMIVKDADLLESMAVKGKLPNLAVIVRVEEAMFHCSKSMIRSNLWKPEKWESVEGLPTYAQALVDHGKLSVSIDDMAKGLEQNAIEDLY